MSFTIPALSRSLPKVRTNDPCSSQEHASGQHVDKTMLTLKTAADFSFSETVATKDSSHYSQWKSAPPVPDCL